MVDTQPLKVLSLDGGGVRGIASLYLLQGLMHQIALDTNQQPESLRPCNYFDLIAGTSTGGLIAIMLGRLRYTVEETIEKYMTLSKDIFSALSSSVDARFDHRILEDRIKKVIISAPCPRPETLAADELLRDDTIELPLNQRTSNGEPNAGCRTFVVCSMPRGSGSRAELLRSYKTPTAFPFKGKIWEAARATSAAPIFFPPITVDHIVYGDGGTGWNNPTKLVINEVRDIWPDRLIGCLVSLGTGEHDPNQLATPESLPRKGLKNWIFSSSMPKKSFQVEVAKYCVNCLTDCTRTHEDVMSSLKRDDLEECYFRLNTPSIGKIGLQEWKQLGDMINLTKDYLNAPEVKAIKSRIASRIKSSHTGPQELSNSRTFEATASTVSNPRSISFSRPVAYLLSFAKYCSAVSQRFDEIKHISPTLRRLNLHVMTLARSLRQLCYDILIQVPSSMEFEDLSEVEILSDPDFEIPLLPLLKRNSQTRVTLFRIVSEIRNRLNDMEIKLKDFADHTVQNGNALSHSQMEALVRSCDFNTTLAKLDKSRMRFQQISARLDEDISEKHKGLQSTFFEEHSQKKATNTDPLVLDSSVLRCRSIRKLSTEVYSALVKVCSDHACHSAQFKLGPHHIIENGSRRVVDFQIRFSGADRSLSWLSIKAPYEVGHCADQRALPKARSIHASSSSVKGVNFLERNNFCQRITSYNQEQCLDKERYLGFFRVGTSTEHLVFFSEAYQRFRQCQLTSLYSIFNTMIPFADKKSVQCERVELAKQVAFAMLQFQNSPLLRNCWGGNDIVFFYQTGTAGNIRDVISAPYLNVEIEEAEDSSFMDIEDDDASENDQNEPFVKNKYLFYLAELLIEIAYSEEIENLDLEEENPCDDDFERERWLVADRLCDNICGNLGSQYRAIVRLCLDCSLKDDHIVEGDRYENMVYTKVVSELEELKIAMVDKMFDEEYIACASNSI